MTVREIINYLKQFDGNREVVVGEQQRYGSDFAYNIEDINKYPFNDWDNNYIADDEREKVVVITLGRQIGTIDYYYDDDDDDRYY